MKFAPGIPPRPPKKAKKPKKPKKPPGSYGSYGGPVYRPPPRQDPLLAQLAAIFGPQQKNLNQQITSEQQRGAQQAAQQQALMQAFAKWYGARAPQQIQQIYGTAATQQTGFAKGFSDGMKIARDQTAGEANKIIGNAGGPEGQMIKSSSAGSDVLYGLGGFIPGSTLSTQGAAFGAAAALMPPAIAAAGSQAAQKILAESGVRLEKLRGQQAELRSKKAQAGLTLREERRKRQAAVKKENYDNAVELYNSGMMTQRQFAKAIGRKDWRKYPNEPKPSDHGGIDASASKVAGVLVYDDGTAVLDRKGNQIPVQSDPNTYSQGGYFWSVDPATGKVTRLGGPGPTKTSRGGSSGGGTVDTYTVPAVTKAKAADWAKQAFWRGVAVKGKTRFDKDGNPISSGGKKLKPMPWESAVNFVLSHLYKDTPRWVAEEALARWYKPGKYGRPKDSAAATGGRENTSLPTTTGVTSGSEFSMVDPEGAPSAGGQRYHAAKDWFAPAGSSVFSVESGVVVEVSPSRGMSGQVYGGVVKIQTADGRVWVFRHVVPGSVRRGQRVKAGQRIARISPWTGGSTHAHIELWKTLAGGYRYENMLDPMSFFGSV
jgi:murein DD-endopeptidase MepM/ murein hydrolase activator NlpD